MSLLVYITQDNSTRFAMNFRADCLQNNGGGGTHHKIGGFENISPTPPPINERIARGLSSLRCRENQLGKNPPRGCYPITRVLSYYPCDTLLFHGALKKKTPAPHTNATSTAAEAPSSRQNAAYEKKLETKRKINRAMLVLGPPRVSTPLAGPPRLSLPSPCLRQGRLPAPYRIPGSPNRAPPSPLATAQRHGPSSAATPASPQPKGVDGGSTQMRGGGRGGVYSCRAWLHPYDHINSRIPTMPGRSTSGFHLPGRHLLAPNFCEAP